MFVRVAIQIPSAKTFTYAVPDAWATAATVGKRVLVPFGRRRVTGFILEVLTEAACEQSIKEIIEIPDPEPLFDDQDLVFYEWISRYYLHPLGKVLGELLPGGLDVKSDRWISLSPDAPGEEQPLSAGRKAILSCLARFPGRDLPEPSPPDTGEKLRFTTTCVFSKPPASSFPRSA